LAATESGLFGGSRRKEVAGVQRFVPQELERGAVELIAAAARGEVDDSAVVPPELRRRAVRFNLEFLDRVDHREVGDLTGLRLQHRYSVEQVFVRPRPAAVDAR